MSSINPKKKGASAEREVATLLRETGVDRTARRNISSGSDLNKSDIHNSLNYNIEVKRRERLNMFNAIEQVEGYSAMNHATPSIFFKRNRMDEWWVAIPYREWGLLIKKGKEPITPSNNKELQFALINLRNAAKRVMRLVRD